MANENKNQAAENAELEEMKKRLADAEAKAKAAEEAKAAAESRAEDAEQKGAAAEAQLRAIAEAENKKKAAAKAGTVRIKIPMEKNGPKDDQQVFINGRQYIIKRGVEVDVPRGVAEILRNREKMLEVITAFDAENAQK